MDPITGTLAIRKFNPKKMAEHCVVLMVAKRRSGKSFLVKDLMYYKRNLLTGVVMSGTENGNGFYGKWIPPIFVYTEFDKEALERLLNRQKKLTQRGIAQGVFVILDDLSFDKKLMNDSVMRELLFNGRHYKITLFICLQYCLDLSPPLRANIDYVFALKENVFREKLFKNFFPITRNLATFNTIMDEMTKDFGVLVLDNTSSSSKLNECVFWYKARADRKPYKLGTQDAWNFSKKRCRKEDDDDVAVEQNKKKTTLVIKKMK
jgi:hypothetical protein